MKYLLLVLLGYPVLTMGQSVTGEWKTIDDASGKARSVVKIEERQGKVYGKILQLFDEENPDPVCSACPGKKKNQKVVGMEIITDMQYDESENAYIGGQILDPESGRIYECKLWLEDGKLMVRGYVMFLYRTQTWLPND